MLVELVKAFTDSINEGNPAGVVFISEQILDSEMLALAKRTNVTATAFLFPPENDGIPIRFFSPRSESTLCVHALLAAAERWFFQNPEARQTIFQTHRESFLVTKSGEQKFLVSLPAPSFGGTVTNVEPLARALRIPTNWIGSSPVEVVATGKPKLIVPLNSLEALLHVVPDEESVLQLCREVGSEGIYLFAVGALDSRCSFHARHWNPIALEREDPICGNGSGALSAYLDRNGIPAPPRFFVEMGVSTKLPGQVLVDRETGIRVGGGAVKFGELSI